MTFEELCDVNLIPHDSRENYRTVWNTAIMQVANLVESKFDECEPWITPDQICELLSR